MLSDQHLTGIAWLSSGRVMTPENSCIVQMQAVEDDRRRLADKLSTREAAAHSHMSDKLARLQAQLACKDAQLLLQGDAAPAPRCHTASLLACLHLPHISIKQQKGTLILP